MTDRSVLLIVPLLLAGILAGSPAARAQDLKFGFTPILAVAEMRAEFEPLMAYLSDAIGQKVVLYIAKDYGDLRTQMEAGTVDIGSFSPFAYVDAVKGGKIRIIAQSILDHSATYRGLVIARKDSGLRRVEDLEGKRFAFVDPKSASGYVYPRAMLLEKGVTPEQAGAICRIRGRDGEAQGSGRVNVPTRTIPARSWCCAGRLGPRRGGGDQKHGEAPKATAGAFVLALAEETKQAIEPSKRFKESIVTEIVPASTFYPAEDYHQDFYKKNPIRYKFYKTTCGRVNRLKQLWGKP